MHIALITLFVMLAASCSTKKKKPTEEVKPLPKPVLIKSTTNFGRGVWLKNQKIKLTDKELVQFRVCTKKSLSKKVPCTRFNPKATRLNWKNAMVMSMASHLVYGKTLMDSGRKVARSVSHTRKIAKVWGFLDYIPIEHKKRDTQIALFVHESFILVAFRGTESRRDWSSNLNLFKHDSQVFSLLNKKSRIWVHRGFSQGAEGVLLALEDQLDTIKKHYKGELPPMWLTGHSLGGALAAIVGGMLHTRKATYTDRLKYFPYGVYTFGMPKVGGIELRDTIEKMIPNFFRFVMEQDIVVALPIQKKFADFAHRRKKEYTWPGDPVFLSNMDCEVEDSWHYQDNPIKIMRLLFKNRQAIKDHKMESYLACVHKNLHTERKKRLSLFD